MITELQYYDLRSRIAGLETDNPIGQTFQQFDEGRGVTFIPESGGETDFSKFCFGFSIAGAVVTIIGGDWPVGSSPPLELENTNVTITADAQYVGIEVDTVNGTIQVIGPSTNKSFFIPDAEKFRTWLHFFGYDSETETATMVKTRLGSLFMPSTFGV